MGSESQSVDYTAVLADLEARKAQIESAITVIRAFMASGLQAVPVTPMVGTVLPAINSPTADTPLSAIQSDTFFGLSILEATKKFLAIRKRPSTATEVVEALRQGGQVNAQNESFGNTLGATLSRSDSGGGTVVRVGRGKYGLREWYGNKPRADE